MNVNYSILTLIASLLYAVVLKYLPDFPIGEDVFQILIGYLVIKILANGEVQEISQFAARKVRARFAPVKAAKKKK
jgi:hypothetical protein